MFTPQLVSRSAIGDFDGFGAVVMVIDRRKVPDFSARGARIPKKKLEPLTAYKNTIILMEMLDPGTIK